MQFSRCRDADVEKFHLDKLCHFMARRSAMVGCFYGSNTVAVCSLLACLPWCRWPRKAPRFLRKLTWPVVLMCRIWSTLRCVPSMLWANAWGVKTASLHTAFRRSVRSQISPGPVYVMTGWGKEVVRMVTRVARWRFQMFFIFIPKFGEDEPILTHIFQMVGKKPPTRSVCPWWKGTESTLRISRTFGLGSLGFEWRTFEFDPCCQRETFYLISTHGEVDCHTSQNTKAKQNSKNTPTPTTFEWRWSIGDLQYLQYLAGLELLESQILWRDPPWGSRNPRGSPGLPRPLPARKGALPRLGSLFEQR